MKGNTQRNLIVRVFTRHVCNTLALLIFTCSVWAQQLTDPIPEKIQKSGIAVELDNLAIIPRSGSGTETHADINFVYPAFDGSTDIYVADGRGIIWRLTNGEVQHPAFLDIADIRDNEFYVNHVRSTGLRSFAFHPDCGRPGRPGNCKLYTAYTETVDSAPTDTPLFEGGFVDDQIEYHNVVAEWRVDLDGAPSVDLSSRRELLRVDQRAKHHNLDQLMFNPNAEPSDSDYGLMWITLGDGISRPRNQDPDDQARDPSKMLGKVARINPLAQGNLPYTIPPSNPFVDQTGYLPELWAIGFRHPQNISFDTGGSEQIYIVDIGESMIEEINLGLAGADYGWPERQGTFLNLRDDPSFVSPLPSNDSSFDFTYPVAQFDHDEGFAIAGGYVYRGSEIPELFGHYIFGDIVTGRVFHVPVSSLQQGFQADVQELTLLINGNEITLPEVVSRARADLRIGLNNNNELLISSKQNGQIWTMKTSNENPALDLLLAPKGDTGNTQPTFSWESIANVSQYEVVVEGSGEPVEYTVNPESAGCENTMDTCMFTGSELNPGFYNWMVVATVDTNPSTETLLGRAGFTIAGDVEIDDFSPNGTISVAQPLFSWPHIFGATEYRVDVNKSTGDQEFSLIATPETLLCGSIGERCQFSEPVFPDGAYDWVVQYKGASNADFTSLGTVSFAITLPTNTGPVVNAGPNISAYVRQNFLLDGTVQGNGNTSTEWSVTEAEGDRDWAVKIREPDEPSQTIKVSRSGRYVVRLTADDGTQTTYDEAVLTIVEEGDPLPDPEPEGDPLPDPEPEPDNEPSPEDNTDPQAWVIYPAAETGIASDANTTLLGGYSDDISGINWVRVRVQRLNTAPAEYWDGAVWGTNSTFLDTTIDGAGGWSLSNVDLSLPGEYRLRFQAQDLAGNRATGSEIPTADFTVNAPDDEAPDAFILSPNSNGEILDASAIIFHGFATDAGGSGFVGGPGGVLIAIQDNNRASDSEQWWNFSTEQFGPTILDTYATLSSQSTGGTDWEITAYNLPSGGDFTLFVLAEDNAGNNGFSGNGLWPVSRQFFTAAAVDDDNTDPTITATNPSDGSTLTPPDSNATLYGTYFDDIAGIDWVRVRVQRLGVSPPEYWNGSAWTNTSTFLDAAIDDVGGWSLSDVDLSLPGEYRLRFQAQDLAGNRATGSEIPTADFFVGTSGTPDSTDPTATATDPAAGDTITANADVTLSGTYFDEQSGIDWVRVRVQRRNVSPAEYWNGAAWTDVSIFLNTTIDDIGGWSLPGVDLSLAGDYRLRFQARDLAGNRATGSELPTADFTVTPAN